MPTASGVAIDTAVLTDEFAADGISVASLRASADAGIRESHFDHSLPQSFREGGNVPALWARSRGQATRLVALTWVEEFQALVTRPDTGIRQPAELGDRRILIPGHGADRVDFGRAMALRGLDATLTLGGLNRSAVTLVDVTTPLGDLVERQGADRSDAYRQELAALRAGEGDAFYVKGAPGVALAKAEGLHVVSDLSQADDVRPRINNGTPRTITVREELLAARPDLVARYLAALLRAASWAVDNPEATHAILAAETGAPVEAAKLAYGDDVHERLRPRLDSELIDALVDQKNFLRDNGFLAADVDIAAWIDPAPLATALGLEQPSAPDPKGESTP